jgi:AraC-like DNA-binding protein
VQIGRRFCKENTVVDKHVHLNWFELTIVQGGEGIIRTNGKDIPVRSGDIHLSLPADLHEILSSKTKPLKYDYCSFAPEKEKWKTELERIIRDFNHAQSRVFSDERIKMLVNNAIAEYCEENREYSKDVLSSIFTQIVAYLIRDFKEKEKPVRSVNLNQAENLCYQAMNYIDTHVFTLKSLSQFSEIFSYNYSYFSALFKKTTGRTLLEYFQSAKLKKAKSLLLENSMTVSEISEHLNYSSVYAFSKAFKKKYGVCPTAIRAEKKQTLF